MRAEFFGDSYDIVKQCFIRWLSPFGGWAVQPMLTKSVSPDWGAEFSRFLGAPLLTAEVLSRRTIRNDYFASGRTCGHLFLDPDKGLWVKPTKPANLPSYLLRSELISLAHARPASLTLVFD